MSEKSLLIVPDNVSAIAWEAIKQLDDSKSQQSILCPNTQWAELLSEEIENLAPKKAQCFLLPPLESDLISHRKPRKHSLLQRVEFFGHYFLPLKEEAPNKKQKIFLFSPESLAQKTAPQSYWREQSLRIKKNAPLNVYKLKEDLEKLYYLQTELVESPFEFAIRGSILDVYSPLYPYPCRIELYADEVHSIRFFHPESQRKVSEVDEFFITPASEYNWLQKGKSPALEHILENEWEKRSYLNLLTNIENNLPHPLGSYWGALYHEQKQGAVFDQWRIDLVVQAHLLESELKRSVFEQEKNILEAREEGQLLPKATLFLRPMNEVLTSLEKSLTQSAPKWIGSNFHVPALKMVPEETQKSPWQIAHTLQEALKAAYTNKDKAPLQPLYELIQAKQKCFFFCQNPGLSEKLKFFLNNQGLDLSLDNHSFHEAQKKKGFNI